MNIRFSWDPKKNSTNEKIHKVTFEKARSVFYDENARLMYDPDHSQDEDRFIILGSSNKLRILVVCHSYRENDQVIRIITARKATKGERQQYTGVLK